MEIQPTAMPPVPLAPRIHRLGRVLVICCSASFALAAAVIVVGAFVLLAAPQYQYPMLTRTAFVVTPALLAMSAFVLAAWGALQALYPAMFVPTVRPLYEVFEGKWIQVRRAGSTATTVRSVFNVCRRLRLWGIYAIPFGIGTGIDMIALANSFSEDNQPVLPLVFVLPIVFLFAIPGLFDQCMERLPEPPSRQSGSR